MIYLAISMVVTTVLIIILFQYVKGIEFHINTLHSELNQLRKEVEELQICLANHLDVSNHAPQPDEPIIDKSSR